MAIDGRDVSGWWGLPFILILVILSFVPNVFPHFWHRWWKWVSNIFLVSIVVAMFGYFKGDYASDFVKILIEYEGFMCLIFALFVTSSGVRFTPHLNLQGTPLHNSCLILIAAFFSNIMGSSGATLLFIRPLVSSNKWRQHAAQTFVFFIFIVCNAGASLSPMGDPPLFIGYIKGVPFFWWLTHLAGPTFTCVGLLMLVYVPIEIYNFNREPNRDEHISKKNPKALSHPQRNILRKLFGQRGSVVAKSQPIQRALVDKEAEHPPVLVAPTDQAVHEAFLILDVDSSGFLEPGEWEQIGSVLGRPFSREDLDAMQAKFGDKGANEAQFLELVRTKFGPVSATTTTTSAAGADVEMTVQPAAGTSSAPGSPVPAGKDKDKEKETSGGGGSEDLATGTSSSDKTGPLQERRESQAEFEKRKSPDRFPKFTAAKLRFDDYLDEKWYRPYPALRYIDGWRNLPLLFAVPVVTFLTGIWAQSAEHVFLFDNAEYLVSDLFRDLFLFFIGVVSYLITSEKTRTLNEFTWDPIVEVVILFSSIFATMLPCIIMLQAGTDGALSSFIDGLTKSDGYPNNLAYYWVSGILSAFLDNTPEFIVLYDVALNAVPLPVNASLAIINDFGGDVLAYRASLIQNEFATTLAAVAAGSVYYGGLTYIGNAPNFFVKNIAEGEKIKLPTFVGFMLWAVAIYIPILAIVGAIFFR